MPAARYWRLIALEAHAGGDLELGALHLYGSAGRVDAAATIASSIAPTTGTLAALQDEDTASTCRFAAAAVRAPGFAITWDFGAGNTADVLAPRLAGPSRDTFLASCTLQYSLDGQLWQWQADFARWDWPGVGVLTNVPAVGDPHFDKVSLLLHFDGADGSTTFTDSSSTPKALTAYSGAVISTAQSKWGGASGYFPGASGNRITIPAGDHFNFGSRDFTIEAWIRPTGLASDNRTVISQYGFSGNRSWDFLIAGGRALFRCTSGGTTDIVGIWTPALQDGRWYHVAVTRSGNVFSIFLDGVLTEFQSSASPVFSSNYTAAIGHNQEGAWSYSGRIDDLRITKDAARYTANFTPPTAPFANGILGDGGSVFTPPLLRAQTPERARIAADSPVPPHSVASAPPLLLARDTEFGGTGRIYGTTKIETSPTTRVPAKARISILRGRDKLLAREVWSDPDTGSWEAAGLDTRQDFVVLAQDAAGNYQPVAADKTMPEEAP